MTHSLRPLSLLTFILISLTTHATPYSTQVHIGLIPPNRISISWVTNESYTTQPIIYLTTTNPKLQNISINSTIIPTYTQSDGGINRYYHHGISPALIPSIQYWYQPGPNATIYTFISRDLTNKQSHNNPFTFLAYGDLGITNSEHTISLIQNLTTPSTAIDFILHFGDISYADDRDLFSDNPQYAKVYDTFGTLLEPIWSAVPYMTSPGNHEQTCHSWSDWHCHTALENFTVYREYFRMPSAAHNETGGGVMNMWWSMDYKNIHILTISTETDYPGSPDKGGYHNDFINPEAGPFGDQMKFVENDLRAAHENPGIKWIIVNGHRPLYTSAFSAPEHLDWPPQTDIFLRDVFEPFFYRYNVDLYIAGHVHGYERMYPIYKGNISTKDYMNPLSTVYFVAGMAGNVEGHSSTVPWKNYTAVYNNRQYGVSRVNVMNDTHLFWEFVEADNGSVIDSVWIKKGHWN